MAEFFPGISKIQYEGPGSKNPLSFKHYNQDEKILGKTMAEHLRFSVCYWHTFRSMGGDMFGPPIFTRTWGAASDPMKAAEDTLRAAFEFFTKLGVGYWCFHDRDIAPEGATLAESNANLDKIVALAKQLQGDTGVKLLWGTACLFAARRYMSGAATSPFPEVFAYAAAQVKKALEVTHELGGAGYVFWGGREGYETLLNTDLKRELDHLGAFLKMAVDYKKKIGFNGQFYIEPKPKEPTKHQYDFDTASCMAFLQKYGLINDFKMNIEANHATLATHTFAHELEFAGANGLLGSVDANRGDYLLGWDTDQFPTDLYDCTLAMYAIISHGGFKTGGLNFDAKVRRQSTDAEDLFHAHIGGMDTFARGLKIAARMIEEGALDKFVQSRYSGWNAGIGAEIESGKLGFTELEAHVLKQNAEPEVTSGRQELLENILNDYLFQG
jgi:xylose isomerase